jgi:hypothetical protein
VLGTRDGGHGWTRLLDGRQANKRVLEHMQGRAAATDAGDDDRKLLAEAQRNADAGPDKPFLDLCFVNANEGFVVGAYGLILRTADGGKTWEPWFDRATTRPSLNLTQSARDCDPIAGEALNSLCRPTRATLPPAGLALQGAACSAWPPPRPACWLSAHAGTHSSVRTRYTAQLRSPGLVRQHRRWRCVA